MSNTISTHLSPQIGIESISNRGAEAPAKLPESCQIVPSGENIASRSVESLYAPKFGAAVQSFLTPKIHARELFIPGVFNRKLQNAAKSLRAAARENQSRTLRHAAFILENDAQLKEQLTAYRQLLQKG